MSGRSASGRELPESRESLWLLVAAPLVWTAHFLMAYGTAAIWCAKAAGPDAPLGPVRLAIAGYTVVALALIAWVGREGWKRHSLGRAEVPHDEDTPEDRHRFLGFATLLLAGLSGVAVVYEALAAVFVETCW